MIGSKWKKKDMSNMQRSMARINDTKWIWKYSCNIHIKEAKTNCVR